MKKGLMRLLIPSSSIRNLVALWVICIVIAWGVLVGSWFVVRRRLEVLGGQVAMNAEALDEARELETQIFAQRHEYLLWKATGEAYHQQLSETHLREAKRVAAGLGPYATAPVEIEELAQIRRELATLQSDSDSQASVEGETKPIYDLLHVVDALQTVNAGQLHDSLRDSNHLQATESRWAIGVSACTAVVLFAGAIGILSRIVRPVLALRRAAASFGRGDFNARVPVAHDDELGALAATFNNMAADIAEREKERLRFVAMVVHDLKNPAYAIELGARQLHESAVDPAKHQLFLDAMYEEAMRLRSIVRDLTDDIQVASGRFSVHKTDVDLSSLVRNLIQTRAATSWDRQIAVEADGECRVLADPARIERVLTNLISNAVKYSPQRTPVTVRIERKRTSAVLSVSDQGVGIEQDDLKMLFQPFGRGRTANTLTDGSGMGLYIVKQIVEAHGGQVDVESHPGRGTTFRIVLPLAPVAHSSSGG